MGIYIKGMEMPVSCWYCDPDFAYAINCSEWKRDDFPHFTTSRPDTCPLIESADVVDCTEFILWILDEIMDEENWELNAVANGEIIARKLKKLGLLEVKDGYYVRTPSAEAEGDLISRQWLLDLYDTPEDGDDVEWKVPLEVVRQNIKDAPSAEAVQGEWIKTEHCLNENGYRKWIELERPFCGFRPVFEFVDDMNFCPNCGAKNKGADDE